MHLYTLNNVKNFEIILQYISLRASQATYSLGCIMIVVNHFQHDFYRHVCISNHSICCLTVICMPSGENSFQSLHVYKMITHLVVHIKLSYYVSGVFHSAAAHSRTVIFNITHNITLERNKEGEHCLLQISSQH